MKFFLALLLATSLTGCAGVLMEPEDSRLTKAGKVAARIPVALVSLGLSELMYLCAQETDTPSWFADDWGDEAEHDWAYLTPQARIAECWKEAAQPSAGGSSYSGYAFQQWRTDTTHHQQGHEHHHGHGC